MSRGNFFYALHYCCKRFFKVAHFNNLEAWTKYVSSSGTYSSKVCKSLKRSRSVIKSIFMLFIETLDVESCECEVPCSQTKYSTEVSYSKFPDPGTAEILDGYYGDIKYQR